MENIRSHGHFPSGCKIVGDVLVSNEDGIEIRKIYIEGIKEREDLHPLGEVAYQQVGDAFETVLTVTQGLPPEIYLG